MKESTLRRLILEQQKFEGTYEFRVMRWCDEVDEKFRSLERRFVVRER